MARSHAVFYVTAWADPEWRELTTSAQRTYWLLLSQGDISTCGVVALSLARWAALAKDSTAAALEADLHELEAARYVLVDRDTHEVLVRTFIHHDRILSKPNVARGMARAWRSVLSPAIRAAVVAELPRRLRRGFPDNLLNGTPAEVRALLADDANGTNKLVPKPVREPVSEPVRELVPEPVREPPGVGVGVGVGGELTSYSSSSGDDEEETDRLTRLWDLLAHRRLDLVTADGHQPTHPDRWLTKVRADMADRHGAQAHELIAQQPDATPEWLADRLDPQTATTTGVPTWEQTIDAIDALDAIDPDERARTSQTIRDAAQAVARAKARRKESA